jgi:hypothetical protein
MSLNIILQVLPKNYYTVIIYKFVNFTIMLKLKFMKFSSLGINANTGRTRTGPGPD